MNVQAPHSPPARNPALHWQFIPKLLLFTTFGFGYTMLMAGPRPDDDIVVWTAYSEDMLQVMRASGIPVVVNVVADWDPSSQYHKKILFADSEIQ